MAMQKHAGGCHCGAVRYKVEVDLDKTITCNCSICTKRGSILAFNTADKFTLEKGEGSLTEYLWNKHVIRHLFCKTCGILSFARGKDPKSGADTVAINVRCLDGIEPDKLKPMAFNGKDI